MRKVPALVIAIDGPASSGKGTVARLLAISLGFDHVDTGAMYRAVALASLRADISWDDIEAVTRLSQQLDFAFPVVDGKLKVLVNHEDVSSLIRGEKVGQGASKVAAIPGVRAALLETQRSLAKRGKVVMDGRDIGTVVLPDADLKIYLDASPAERARRRFMESPGSDFDAIYRELIERDHRDMSRSVAPLKAADDAIRVDTTGLAIEEVVAQVLNLATAA
jgi:cytidylate kinase